MLKKMLAPAFLCLVAAVAWAAEDRPAQPQADPQLARQISRIIGQLNDDQAAERDAAEKKLLDLSGTTAAQSDRFLQSLPKETDQMPIAVRERLARIRKQVEDRAAKSATAATTMTLSAKDLPLTEVIAAIEKQTGNRFIDNRDQQREQPNAK